MICDYEVEYGPRILLVGDVSITNDSFDHAFGTQPLEPEYEATAFRVFEYSNRTKEWVNVTSMLSEKDPIQLKIFEKYFLLRAERRIRAEEESA